MQRSGWMRPGLRTIRAIVGAGIVLATLTSLLRIDLPVWLGAPIWAFVILAVIGTIYQAVTKPRREPVLLPTGEAPKPIEIGHVGQHWIQVVKVLRDHSVIEKPHELAREVYPTVVAVDPGEVEVVIRRLAQLGVSVRRVGSGPSGE